MMIAVIGMGKIGQPLAAQFAEKGHEVIGVDVNAATVDTINRGEVPFPGETPLDKYLERLVPSGGLRSTTDYTNGILKADAVVIVVPLLVDTKNKPDFGWMDSATRDLAANVTSGTLVATKRPYPSAPPATAGSR